MTDLASAAALWPAPAKLNLFLHITGRRADGYHELQTVFQFLDYGDDLQFTLRDDGLIHRTSELAGVPESTDLVIRAARALQIYRKSYQGADIPGVDIHVDKRLPIGGGLGGGSSNAATTLVALNSLWGCGLSLPQLTALGLRLGADVPVFIHGFAAWAEGVGEVLTPVDLPEPWFLVIRPPVDISTASIFSATELTRNCPAITISGFSRGAGVNVCEPVARKYYPEVGVLLDWLNSRGESTLKAHMTGTGSCIFAEFESRQSAQDILRQIPDDCTGFVARGINRSPLLNRLETSHDMVI